MNEEPTMLFWLAIVTLAIVVVLGVWSYLRTRRAQRRNEHSAMTTPPPTGREANRPGAETKYRR